MAALWTEVCLVFPALDALRQGYEVFPVVDAVGGTSLRTSCRSGLSAHCPGRRSPSAGSRSPANYNATGLGSRPFPKLSKSCSRLDSAGL